MNDSGLEIIIDSLPSRRAILQWAAAGMIVLGIALPALLGRGYSTTNDSPSGVRILTWQDWQMGKLQAAYEQELAALRNDWDALNTVLAQPPDPIAAGLLHDRISSSRMNGLSALANHRAALLAANDAVYDWASAANTFENAAAAMQTALDVLSGVP